MELFGDHRLHLPDAELDWYPHWLPSAQADAWLQALIEQVSWSQPQVQLFGRWHRVPRLVAWYGDPQASYGYSGQRHQPLAWTALLQSIRQAVEQAAGASFNAVLLNYYRDGQDCMGWHSDDEAELGAQPCIASLSLGQARRFDLRRRGSQRIEHSVLLEHGSLLVMRGSTQHHWQHQVARSRKISAPRINLTFRRVNP